VRERAGQGIQTLMRDIHSGLVPSACMHAGCWISSCHRVQSGDLDDELRRDVMHVSVYRVVAVCNNQLTTKLAG
jgi:hypothetical protein